MKTIRDRLLLFATIFLFLESVILTLSPAVRAGSWNVELRWGHWIGFAVWLVMFAIVNWQIGLLLPESDPVLIAIAALFSGWGVITIWRLDPTFGLRQTIWLGVSLIALILSLRWPSNLNFLRRYRSLWLASGLALTALTLLFGVNPQGGGPRLWLGCCGFYFQPSEPLKLLLIVYLAAYLADLSSARQRMAPLLIPTLFLTGVAILILVVQRDLGTASIFIFLYAAMLYMATDRKRIIFISLLSLVMAGLVGYFFIDVIRTRFDVWLDPWKDPSGHAYQVIQSLMAVANGGLPGRGLGIGFPRLVPVAISDFIFSAIAEEGGLLASLVILGLIGALVMRSLRSGILSPGHFRRLLAAGIAAYFGAQSIFIIGGNLRLLPLTGVTLPFFSYGGSSLFTSFLALSMVLHISSHGDDEPAPLPRHFPYLALGGFLLAGLAVTAIADAWWGIYRAPVLLARSDNPRRSIADLYVRRGDLLDRDNNPIDVTQGQSGEYKRAYLYPDLAPITGYTDPVFGQGGLEAGLDSYLRGLKGNPSFLVWWDRLLTGFPPPGLDMRTSLQLSAQRVADQLMKDQKGAAILLDAKHGDILAMSSHPTYDPNQLAQESSIFTDPDSPLLNRATQGNYSLGSLMRLIDQAGAIENGNALSSSSRVEYLRKLGFYTEPQLPLITASASPPNNSGDLLVSPLQVALAVASLSSEGNRPPARIGIAANTPAQGWVILPSSSDPVPVFSPKTVGQVTSSYLAPGTPYWEYPGASMSGNSPITWYIAGTLTDWPGTPLVAVVALEENNPELAQKIGRAMLDEATRP